MITNVTVIQGDTYTVEKRNLPRNTVTAFPEAAVLLHSEVVVNGEEEVLEVWLAIPLEKEHDADSSYQVLGVDEIRAEFEKEDA